MLFTTKKTEYYSNTVSSECNKVENVTVNFVCESLHRGTEGTEDLGVSQEVLEQQDPQGPRWVGQ